MILTETTVSQYQTSQLTVAAPIENLEHFQGD